MWYEYINIWLFIVSLIMCQLVSYFKLYIIELTLNYWKVENTTMYYMKSLCLIWHSHMTEKQQSGGIVDEYCLSTSNDICDKWCNMI